jgi:hypothetical protein
MRDMRGKRNDTTCEFIYMNKWIGVRVLLGHSEKKKLYVQLSWMEGVLITSNKK